MKKRESIVSLTGGLGNQLFQLAFALSRNNQNIILDASLGKPRKTTDVPDIQLFKLPNFISGESSTREAPILFQKIAGFLLRIGVQHKDSWWKNAGFHFQKFVCSFFLGIYFGKFLYTKVCQGVGYFVPKTSQRELVIGYFQTYKFFENDFVKTILMGLEPINTNRKLIEYILEAKEKNPIFMHLRLSDYLAEKNFGICASEYYQESISKLNDFGREIWVFSDDSMMASMRLKTTGIRNLKYIDDIGFNPAQILHLFRFGGDYVIANSSFSWWGAALRFNQQARVIAPTPWFLNMVEPTNLIPSNWLRVESRLE